MKFDALGLPQDNGASDLQDSARLAGIMTVFEHPATIPIGLYVDLDLKRYQRHPFEIVYDFSRDQAVCLMAGLGKIRAFHFVREDYITGRDILPPSVQGHIRRCQGGRASWFQDLWLCGEIIVHALVTPLGEPNQLLCMLMIHSDKKYLRAWCRLNPKWEQSILDYWALSYRNEPELAALMIDVIKKHNTPRHASP